MNAVEYALRLRDFASGPLNQLTQRMQNNIRTAREMREAHRQASSGLDLGRMLKGGAIIGAAVSAGRMAGEFFGGAMKDALERQKIQTSFNVLAGGDAAGKQLTRQLVELQRDTILGNEVFKNAQTMMAFGADSTQVAADLKMLGDITMGDTERLNSLTLAFSQSRAAGKLMGQDLLQMVNAGFNPLQVMSEKTGRSMEALKDDMSKGLITFDMIHKAFRDATSEGGRYNNMLAKIAETPAGKTQQLKGMWGEVKIAIGNALMPLLSWGVEIGRSIMPVIESITGPLANGISIITGRMQQIFDYARQIVGTTDEWQPLMEGIGFIWNTVMGFASHIGGIMADMVLDIVEFVRNSTFLRDIFINIGRIANIVFSVVKWVMTQLKFLWDEVVMPILNGIEKVWRWLNGGSAKTTIGIDKPAEEKQQERVTQETLREIATNTKANASVSAAAGKAISSGGQKTINIHVNKFFDNIQFRTDNTEAVSRNIENVILECLSRILVQGAASAV